jgi:hypothetical protein
MNFKADANNNININVYPQNFTYDGYETPTAGPYMFTQYVSGTTTGAIVAQADNSSNAASDSFMKNNGGPPEGT